MAIHAPVDEHGRELCARCWRVKGGISEEWEHVPADPGLAYICQHCVTYAERRQLNTQRRLRGLAERPVGPVPPSVL